MNDAQLILRLYRVTEEFCWDGAPKKIRVTEDFCWDDSPKKIIGTEGPFFWFGTSVILGQGSTLGPEFGSTLTEVSVTIRGLDEGGFPFERMNVDIASRKNCEPS